MALKGVHRERRQCKDRRKHVDPRYRSADYSEFVDKRKDVERRAPAYEDVPHLIKEHPRRKWVILIGLVIASFLIYSFCFTNLILEKKCIDEKVRKRTITLGYYYDGRANKDV